MPSTAAPSEERNPYRGQARRTTPLELLERFSGPPRFADRVFHLRYDPIDLVRLSDEEITGGPMVRSMVQALRHVFAIDLEDRIAEALTPLAEVIGTRREGGRTG